jgi:polar amino acid transport system permease protein
VLGLWLLAAILLDPVYSQILAVVSKGVGVTIYVTVVAFALASAFGLGLAVCVLSGSVLLRQAARFYIEIIRGIPILVLLFYIAFVAVPAFVAGWNVLAEPLGLDPLRTRDVSFLWRAIIALTIGYAAFIAEVFRAGIQSVEPGQIEAAKALGLTAWQRFRLIVLPQAIRTILPPLGNDFIAMIKDSALVSFVSLRELFWRARTVGSAQFRSFETLIFAAIIYWLLTIVFSLFQERLEKRMAEGDRRS